MAIILITGATAGFGKACAEKFAAGGYDLIITGRREERLSALKATLEQQHGIKVLPLTFDVRNEQAVYAALDSIPEEWKQVSVLINNAGLAAGLSTIDEG